MGEASDKVSHITAENFWLGDSETLQLDEFKFYLNIRKIPTKAWAALTLEVLTLTTIWQCKRPYGEITWS